MKKVWAIYKTRDIVSEEVFDVSTLDNAERDVKNTLELIWNCGLRHGEDPRFFIRLGRIYDSRCIEYFEYLDIKLRYSENIKIVDFDKISDTEGYYSKKDEEYAEQDCEDKKPNPCYGWMDRNGKVHTCGWMEHDNLAISLGLEVKDMENKGWIRLWGLAKGYSYESKFRMTINQKTKMKRLGFSGIDLDEDEN